MDDGPLQLPQELREHLQAELDECDASTEAVALRILYARDAVEFYDAERAVAAMMRVRGDQLVAAVLRHRASTKEFVEPARARAHEAGAKQQVRLKSNGQRKTRVQLLGGMIVTLMTLRLRPVMPPRRGRKRGVGRRGTAGTGMYPALAELGITGLATPALMAEVAREVAESASVDVARASLRERGLDIPHKTALRLTYQFAERALALRQGQLSAAVRDGPPKTGELAGKRIVVSVDGGRVRIRKNPTAGRRNAKTRHHRYQAPWKEPKLMSVYVSNDQGERDKGFAVLLDATMGDADDAMALLVGHLRLRAAHLAEHVTFIGDGAAWIWARAQELRHAVGIEPERFTEVVDWYHACEHLHEVAAIPKNWTDTDRKTWVKKAKRHLYAGRVEPVIEAIQGLRVGRRGKAVGQCIGYFQTHCERMRYADVRKQGLPMGSGAVESAIRRVVNLRMKGNSMYWLPDHAEAMLHLRSFLKAGRWDELVRSTIRQPVWKPSPAAVRAA